MVIWLYRAIASWLLGYPDAALADTNQALADTRAIGQAGTLMFALLHASLIDMLCRDYAATSAATDELAVLAEQKGALFWKALGLSMQGCMCAMTGKAADAVTMITSGIAASRSTGATLWVPVCFRSPRRTRTIRRRLALHWRGAKCRGDDQGKLVRG